MEKNKQFSCTECHCDIDMGKEALVVEEGVIGTKDFVGLKKDLIFCSERCLSSYFNHSDLPQIPRRIP